MTDNLTPSDRRQADRFQKEIDASSDGLESELGAAFLLMLFSIGGDDTFREIKRSVRSGDFSQALFLSNSLTEAGVETQGVKSSLRDAIIEGARVANRDLNRQISSRSPVKLQVDVFDESMARLVREYESSFLREMAEGQRSSIRAVITNGVSSGTPLSVIANNLDGIVGLNERQAKQVERISRRIIDGDRRLLNLVLMDDSDKEILRRAFDSGQRVPIKQARDIVARYRDNYAAHRARTIAATEVRRLTQFGADEEYKAAVRSGVLRSDGVRRYWVTAGDERVRATHRLIPGLNPDGRDISEPFDTPIGRFMSPPIEVNCRCTVWHKVIK